MTKPDLLKMGMMNPVTFHKYERYLPTAFDESLSILEKINKMICYMNEIGELTNDMLAKWNEVYEWILQEGLTEETRKAIQELINSGRLEQLINLSLVNSNLKRADYHHDIQEIAVLGKWKVRTAGDTRWVQAATLVEVDGEDFLFVAYQDSESDIGAAIEKRQLNTTTFEFDLVESKEIASTGKAIEGLPYFFSEEGELHFVLHSIENDTHGYQIYNWDTNTMSSFVPMAGVNTQYCFDDNNNFISYDYHGVTIYKDEDIIHTVENAVPLANKIQFDYVSNSLKTQGISAGKGHIYVWQGGSKTHPALAVYDYGGRLVKYFTFAKKDLAKAVNMVWEGHIQDEEGFHYENEGGFFHKNAMYSVQNISSDEFVIVAHNQKSGGVEWGFDYHTNIAKDTGWQTLNLLNGCQVWEEGKELEIRRIENIVYLRGELKIPANVWNDTLQIAEIPATFRPDRVHNTVAQPVNEANIAFYKIYAGGSLYPLRTNNETLVDDDWYSIETSWVCGDSFW